MNMKTSQKQTTQRQFFLITFSLLFAAVLSLSTLQNAHCSDTKIENTVTETEAKAFAKKFESAVASGKNDDCLKLFNVDLFIKKASKGLKLPLGFKGGLKIGAFTGKTGTFHTIIQASRGNGSYQFLRVRKNGGQCRILFRLLLPNDGGMNYHEYMLEKQNGKVQAVDIYIYLTGEKFSKTLRRMIIPTITVGNKKLYDKLSQKEKDFADNVSQFGQYANAVRTQKLALAESLYKKFPKSMKGSKMILILQLQFAQLKGDDEIYAKTLTEFHRLYPNDPAMLLVSIDYYAIKEDHKKLVNAIKKLERAVGGDPHLEELREAFE